MKVYDCFTFFNEFELLELRLNLLDNSVDYFVLVEADKTYKGDYKEFYFENNKAKFEKYLHKIIHIKLDDMPNYDPKDEWLLEIYQRNAIVRGLQGLDAEDIIFIGDVDEIPDENVLELLRNGTSRVNFWIRDRLLQNIFQIIRFPESIFKTHGLKLLNKTPLALKQSLFYYFLNCRSKGIWNGTVITKAKHFSTPQKLRDRRNKFPRIENGGWHFSYLGGVEKILQKLNSIILQKLDSTSYNSEYSIDYVKHCMDNGLDIYGRKGKEFEYEFIDVEKVLPEPVRNLAKKYPDLHYHPK